MILLRIGLLFYFFLSLLFIFMSSHEFKKLIKNLL